jgi:hypothetical protein
VKSAPELTRHHGVNAVLHLFLSSVRAILADHFLGMYLYGSLASGDFRPDTSDIDFLVVTVDEISSDLIQALEVMHDRMNTGSFEWAKKLEGCYIPQLVLRRHNPGDRLRPCVNEGRFYLGYLGSDWVIQRCVLRESGIALAGPDPRRLIDEVSPCELKHAIHCFLREWWLPMLSNHDRLRSREYQAYAVLTMCRALHTLHHGTVISKQAAARWALQSLDQGWQSLILWASAWPRDVRRDRLRETRAFIRYAIECDHRLAGNRGT